MAAYRLKQISYQNRVCHILLQNENGPCPLIAAANVLILRGTLSLNPISIRASVISIDDLIHELANFALQRHSHAPARVKCKLKENGPSENTASTSGAVSEKKDEIPMRSVAPGDGTTIPMNAEDEKVPVVLVNERKACIEDDNVALRQKQREMHVHEMMSLLPELQYGLDVNPKFTKGPDSCEFTIGLTTFDVLGVDLVHGWLVDPQNVELRSVLETKSYNELVDLVIRGNDAKERERILTQQVKAKEDVLDKKILNEWVNVDPEPALVEEKKGEEDDGGFSSKDATVGCHAERVSEMVDEITAEGTCDPLNKTVIERSECCEEEEIGELKSELAEARETSGRGQLIADFLNDTGHQLTYYGLEKLHEYMSEGTLSVFFRNNHFSTIVKHAGKLFLLVTDLGYANVPDVQWERLDGIDGDSDYVDCLFNKTKPQSAMTPSGPILNPEHVLTQRGQKELDYQLAMRLQSGKSINDTTLDAEEAALLAAATEASLNSFHDVAAGPPRNANGTVVSMPPAQKSAAEFADNYNRNEISNEVRANQPGGSENEDADRVLAMSLQSQFQNEDASERLARYLHEEEQRQAAALNTRGSASTSRATNATPTGGGKPSCIIS